MSSPKFPLFISLDGKKVLIAGAGKIASRRVKTLLKYGADVTVIAPEADSFIIKKAEEGLLCWEKRPFQVADIEHAYMVIAATGSAEINQMISKAAREKGALANNASDQSDCDFFFPAVITPEGLSIGVCGNGTDHHAVADSAAQIRKMYGIEDV